MGLSYPAARDYARTRGRAVRTNVLVIAPHPDDDVIGCGGTLGRLAARGARIDVLYVTDGSASHTQSKCFPPARLRDIREDEARAALRNLGIRRKPYFLRAPDGGLTALAVPERRRLVAAIAARIASARTHLLFSPWLRDPHPDHVATANIVHDALRASSRRPVQYLYGVWLPVRGANAEQPQPAEASVVEVRLAELEVARKRNAIVAHRSQTGHVVHDDPDGFVIDAALLATWLLPLERFYRLHYTPPALGGTRD